MEVWWLSPSIVAVGIIITIVLGARRDAKHSGVVDTLLDEHDRRMNEHGQEINILNQKIENHSHRLTSVEVHCDTLHSKRSKETAAERAGGD
jgi:hypothetical protein